MADIEVKSTFFCDYVTIDKADKLSLMGIFQRIQLLETPGSVPRFFVVILFKINKEIEADTFKFETKLLNPEGNNLLHKPLIIQTKPPRETQNGQLIFEIDNLKFGSSGNYKFQLYLNEKMVTQENLEVIKK